MKLREYQTDAIQSIYDWFGAGKNAPLIVTPTGSGKSVILAEFIRRACSEYHDTQILVVTHVKELVEQDAKAIKRVWPHAPVGIYSAGLGKRQLKPVTVASIQSIYNKTQFHGRFDLIIIDEAHLIPHKSDGMYRKLLDACLAANPYTKLIGLTATPYRLDSGVLHEGDGALFDGISYEANVADLIGQGFLSNLTSKHGDDVDLEGVRTVGGEYNLGQLGERMSAIKLVEHHAELIVQRCAQREAWLIFCVTVEHASQMAAALGRRGIASSYVSGEMSNTERDEQIRRFKSGELRALVNCSILTTGFDHPATDAVVMLRPTLSPGLYVQMVGRGLRLHEGKTDCLVLDFGGNVRRHGFIDQVIPPRKGKKGPPGEAPVKTCPTCSSHVPIMSQTCPECGFKFPVIEREAEKVHHVGAILSTEVPPVEMTVTNVEYMRHHGKSGVDTLRVTYYCGIRSVSEYVCLEHQGYARSKAVAWWNKRCDLPAPILINQALLMKDELARPAKILVNFATKYPEIKGYTFEIEETSIHD
jgi:DNA repair protein RadD